MARPPRNDIDYFPHPVVHGRKMFYIEQKYGNDGYSTWFKILEELGSANYHYLNLQDNTQVMYLSSRCNISEKKLTSIIDDLVKLGEFNMELWQHKILFNEKFVLSVADAYKKRNNDPPTFKKLVKMLKSLGILKSSFRLRKQSLKAHKPSLGRLSSSDNPQRKEEKTIISGTTIEDPTIYKVKASNKLSGKKENFTFPDGKDDFLNQIIQIFRTEYENYFKIELLNIFSGKNRRAAGHLLEILKTKYPEYDSEQMLKTFQIIFQGFVRVKDKWYSEHMSLSLISGHFDELIKIYKNEKAGKSSQISDWDIAELIQEGFSDKPE